MIVVCYIAVVGVVNGEGRLGRSISLSMSPLEVPWVLPDKTIHNRFYMYGSVDLDSRGNEAGQKSV